MGEVRAMAAGDRLPWLSDEPRAVHRRPRGRGRWPVWLAAALLALAAIAAAAYWFGMRTASDSAPPADTKLSHPPVTVPLPAPKEALPAQPQVRIEPQPEVEPVILPAPRAAPPSQWAPPQASRSTRALVRSEPRARPAPTPKAKAPPAEKKAAPLPIWPVRAEQNAAGRLVRIGTFASPLQAKRGWRKIMRFYPGMQRLPALVVPIRAVPSGRQYYRIQMGTTSQAHSEVLCQRMRIVGVSCVVLDIGPTARPRR